MGPRRILFSQTIQGNDPTIYEHACRLGAEWIISKRRGSFLSKWLDTCREIQFGRFIAAPVRILAGCSILGAGIYLLWVEILLLFRKARPE
jgi:hypothetical protein